MIGIDKAGSLHLCRFFVATLFMALVAAGQGRAESSLYSPPSLLILDKKTELSVVAEQLALTPDAVFVVGYNRDGAQVLRLNPVDLAIVAQTTLDGEVQDLFASAIDDRLYVLANSDEETKLLVYDGKLQQIAQFSTGRLLAAATLSQASEGLLAIGGLPNGKSDGTFVVANVQVPSHIYLLDLPNFPIAARGVAKGWFVRQDRLVLLNTGDAAALLAISAENGRTISYISGPQTKDPRVEPFAVQGSMPDQACRMGDTPTFLISSIGRNRLTLAEYARVFSTLNILSEVEPGLSGRQSDPKLQAQDGTDILRPLGLLASSCNREVVWAGSLNASSVVQYAVNPTSRVLEKVGTIPLASRPVDLAVSEDGGSAFALYGNGQIQRYAASSSNAGLILGEPDVRALQRALTEKGYPVGDIDGMLGARTMDALQQFQKQTGIVVDPIQDINAAIDAISGIYK